MVLEKRTRIRPLESPGTCLCMPEYMLQHRLHTWKESQSHPPPHGNWKFPSPQSIWNVVSLGLWPLGPSPEDSSAWPGSAFLASAGLRGALWPEGFARGSKGSSTDRSSDITGRGLSGTEPLHVTAVAEQVPIQREATAAFFITQLHPAVLGKKDT